MQNQASRRLSSILNSTSHSQVQPHILPFVSWTSLIRAFSAARDGATVLAGITLIAGCLSTFTFGGQLATAYLKNATLPLVETAKAAKQNENGTVPVNSEESNTSEIVTTTQIIVLLVILGLVLSPVISSILYRAWLRRTLSNQMTMVSKSMSEMDFAQDEVMLPLALKNSLLQSTLFDDEELESWYRGFLRDCPSGLLDMRQFQSVYRNFFPRGRPDKFSLLVFRVFDQKSDGYVDFEEFVTTLSVTSRGTTEQKIDWAFQLYDLDEGGRISYDNMLNVVNAIYEMVGDSVIYPEDEQTPEARTSKLFGMMDTDNDGYISLDEFRSGSLKDPAIMSALTLYQGLA